KASCGSALTQGIALDLHDQDNIAADRIEDNGVRTVTVEDASRFGRDLVTQQLGILALINRNFRVLTANSEDLTDSSDPSRAMMRQIAVARSRNTKRPARCELRYIRRSDCAGPRPMGINDIGQEVAAEPASWVSSASAAGGSSRCLRSPQCSELAER